MVKVPLNILIRPETFKALSSYADSINKHLPGDKKKSLSYIVEDAIIMYLSELGLAVDLPDRYHLEKHTQKRRGFPEEGEELI